MKKDVYMERRRPLIYLDKQEIASAVRMYCPNKEFTYEILQKGLSNTNYLINFDDSSQAVVLRLHHDAARAEKEYKISKLLLDNKFVPRVLLFAESENKEYKFSILKYHKGKTLSDINDTKNFNLYYALAEFLLSLTSIKYDKAGFFDESMGITPIVTKENQYNQCINYIMDCLRNKILASRVNKGIRNTISKTILRYEKLLDNVYDTTYQLVHGDFKLANILVYDDATNLSAVLDWEYARSDTIYADLASLLRGVYISSKSSAIYENISAAFYDYEMELLVDWQKISKCIDFINLLSFLCDKVDRPILYSRTMHNINDSLDYLS